MTYNKQGDIIKDNINIASKEFFQVSLVTYLLLTLAETLKEGFVSNFFDMNYLLAVVLVTGIAMVLTEPAESPVGQAARAVRDQVVQTADTVGQTAARALPPAARRHVDAFAQRAPHVLDLSKVQLPPKKAKRLDNKKRQLG